jgi:hypothetical protein
MAVDALQHLPLRAASYGRTMIKEVNRRFVPATRMNGHFPGVPLARNTARAVGNGSLNECPVLG